VQFHYNNVCVIDEMQMITDAQCGFLWTVAVLSVCVELHLCSEEAVVPLIGVDAGGQATNQGLSVADSSGCGRDQNKKNGLIPNKNGSNMKSTDM